MFGQGGDIIRRGWRDGGLLKNHIQKEEEGEEKEEEEEEEEEEGKMRS